MTLVTVGTQFFDGLIDEVDRLAADGVLDGEILAQIGLSREPQNVPFIRFTADMPALIRDADLVITHAGTGSVIQCLTANKRFIAVVNDTKAGNHQREFVEDFGELFDFCWIGSPAELADALPHARRPRPVGDSGLDTLAAAIRTAGLASSKSIPEPQLA